MRTEDSLQQFGLVPKQEDLPSIRDLLAHEADCERKSEGREDDLALLCCVQLFSRAKYEDVLLIWDAKSSGFDLFSSLDVQLLCGNGLQNTKDFLKKQTGDAAAKALAHLNECEAAGDFEEFSPTAHLDHYRAYFGVAT